MIWLVGLCLIMAGVVAALAAMLHRTRARLQILAADVVLIGDSLRAADRDFEAVMAEVGGSRIVVEVLNTSELARSRSRIGGVLTGVAPRLIRRRVYDEVAREMKRILADEHGVEAELHIFHPTGV